MKKLLIPTILCISITYSCQHNKTKTVSKDTKEVIRVTEKKLAEEVKEVVPLAPKEIKKKERRSVLDSISRTSSDGDTLKIMMYEYLYLNNKKYLRDFDIVNSSDSVILSAMQKEYHWEGDVSADDIGQINIIPAYYLKNDSIMNLAFGFYINPYDIAEELDRYDIGSVREYLSYSFDEYLFEDSVMTFMNFTLTSKNLDHIKFQVKLNNEDIISNDSVFNILENNKENTSWGLTAVINGSIKNMINGSMTYDELKSIPLLFKYHQSNSDLSINRYFIQSIVYHLNNRDYSTIYRD